MKRPSFQFYPSDWLRDTALRSCSTGARGLWMDMICFMHEGNPYGHLKVGDKVILPPNLARMVGETLEVVQGWLDELQEAGVYDLAEDGAIYSRRMIRDENLRKIRAEGGKLGGNPALTKAEKDNGKVNLEDKQKPTPSSSSSSSSSNTSNKGANAPATTTLPPCPQEELIRLYAKHLPHLTQPRIWDGARAASLRQRWQQCAKPSAGDFGGGYDSKEGGLEFWDSFFGYIANGTTLAKGFESQGRVWRPDLEWICKPANFAKIVDGKYAK